MFVKGKSGNPKGRPTNENAISNIIDEVGNRFVDSRNKKTYWEALSERIFSIAVYGEDDNNVITAAKYLLDRRFGRPKEMVDAKINGDITIKIKKY